jgi:apolipoprotein N-acyltransferase
MLSWVADVLLTFGGASRVSAYLLTLALAAAFGLFVGAFGALQAHVGRAFGVKALLLAPFLFVTCEFLREHLLFGFPWCLLGYSQVDFPELVQVAAFTAVHGVSFLLVSASAGIAHALLNPSAFERRIGITLPALLISMAMAFGHGRLQQPLPGDAAFPVGVIQASIPQEQKWDAALLQSNIERHLALSREAAKRQARLVVWPESAIAYELDLYPEVRKQITDFTRSEHVFLLTGNDDRERDAGGAVRSYVGAKLVTPGGDITMRYHKMRLVPFGEYLPLPSFVSSFLPIARLVESVSDFTPGKSPETGEVLGVPVSVFICYEAIFPSLVRRFPMNGAKVLFNVTNDGWYGTSAAPYQHYAMARFRAVENHRFLVRAANTGISAIIDPFGREIARTELMEKRALVGDVRAISEMTFYARHGDVFAWSVVALAALAMLAALVPRTGRSNRLSPSPESVRQESHGNPN